MAALDAEKFLDKDALTPRSAAHRLRHSPDISADAWDALHDGAQSVRRARLPRRPRTARLPARGLGLDAASPDAVGGRRAGRRGARLPQGQLARRIRVRPCLGACLRALRPRLLPEVAVRGALLARHRPAPAGARRCRAARVARTRSRRICATPGLSSAHVNFHRAGRGRGVRRRDWLPRIDVQYHWRNDAGWRDFDEFLAAMDHKHRKNIRQERAKVAARGRRVPRRRTATRPARTTSRRCTVSICRPSPNTATRRR